MTEDEVRNIFNHRIDELIGRREFNKVSKLELVREYCTNPNFKMWLEDFLWVVNNASEEYANRALTDIEKGL